MNRIHPTNEIYPGVSLGKNIRIGANSVIGEPTQMFGWTGEKEVAKPWVDSDYSVTLEDDVPDYSFGYGHPFKELGRADSLSVKTRLATSWVRRKLRRVLK